jgi:hypothetical protein
VKVEHQLELQSPAVLPSEKVAKTETKAWTVDRPWRQLNRIVFNVEEEKTFHFPV